MPNVVHVWEKYGGDKFLVVGVNLDDSETGQKMRDFVRDKGITFTNITDYVGWQSPIARAVDLSYVPQSFLLAPDGTVILRDLRGDDLEKAVNKAMKLEEPYPQITMKIKVDNDPREEEGFVSTGVDLSHWTDPDAEPVNLPPDEIKLKIYVDNQQEEEFEASLLYTVHRATGRTTQRVMDPFTKEVVADQRTGTPIVYHEAVTETEIINFKGENGEINTDCTICLDDDVIEVNWELYVHSPVFDMQLTGAPDAIDFALFSTMNVEAIESQGGIYFTPEV